LPNQIENKTKGRKGNGTPLLQIQENKSYERCFNKTRRKENTIVPIREVLFHAASLENQFKETTLPVEVHSIRAVLPTYWFLHLSEQSATFGENGDFRSFLSFRYTNTFRHPWSFSWQMYQTYLGYLLQIQLPKGTPWKELEPGNKASHDQHEAIGTRSSVVPRLF
jgi:hypothetical protein